VSGAGGGARRNGVGSLNRAASGPGARGGLSGALAALVCLVAAAVLAVGLVSADEGWALTHPPVQPVAGDPGTQAELYYRCLPYVVQPELCGPKPLFTPRRHLPISAWIMPSIPTQQAYPEGSGTWSAETVVLVPDHGQSRTPAGIPVWHIASLLVSNGYYVVMYDPRATGNSGGAGIGFGTLEVSDLLTVVDYLQALGGPPQGHIAVWGFGTGADTAILAAARDANIQAVIADSPYATPEEYLRREIPGWTHLPAFPFTEGILWAMQTETGVRYGAYDPVAAAAALGGRNPRPLLVVYGQDDSVTPPADARRIYAAAGSRAFPYAVPGAGHLQAYLLSPGDADVPSETVDGNTYVLTQYDCLVLNTLQAMHNGQGNASPTGPAGPCGAASPGAPSGGGTTP
jgi:pimeloyl-ACP methyl ester carboxylesterase